MAEKKNILTSSGAKKLQEELQFLTVQRREEIILKIKEARAQGDLSENAEYDAAKEEQAQNEARISEIEGILKNAEIVDENVDTDKVFIGAEVKVLDKTDNEEISYIIVGSNEADCLNGKISNESPLGKALIGGKMGQTVEVEAPAGKFAYEILEIKKANL